MSFLLLSLDCFELCVTFSFSFNSTVWASVGVVMLGRTTRKKVINDQSIKDQNFWVTDIIISDQILVADIIWTNFMYKNISDHFWSLIISYQRPKLVADNGLCNQVLARLFFPRLKFYR